MTTPIPSPLPLTSWPARHHHNGQAVYPTRLRPATTMSSQARSLFERVRETRSNKLCHSLEAENKRLKDQLKSQSTPALEPTTNFARRPRLQDGSEIRGKPPIWRPYVNPLKTDFAVRDKTTTKRGPRAQSTEPVIKCSRIDAADQRTITTTSADQPATTTMARQSTRPGSGQPHLVRPAHPRRPGSGHAATMQRITASVKIFSATSEFLFAGCILIRVNTMHTVSIKWRRS